MSAIQPSDCKVALLAGGSSGEREISLLSGKGAEEALRSAGFDPVFLDPSSKEDLKRLMEGDFDVAFICLHGKGGEDGLIQGFLETIGLPYTGSGVQSSAIAIDKAKAKVLYSENGLPTPSSVVISKNAYSPEDVTKIVGAPCVVKPSTEGSALGVYIALAEEDIAPAIDKAFKIDDEILVEDYITGVEITVAVLGNEDPQALPVIEIVPVNHFYDFESKYAPGGSQHICPARLDSELTQKVQDLAVKAHQALGCRGVSRTDMIVDINGDPWILETNTIPGMTSTSLLPDAARAAGVSFPELCTKLIDMALE